MADYPERTVTAQTNMAEYERAMRVEKLRKKYGNMLWNVSALRGRGWGSTSAAQKWKSAINSGGSSLTGLSTRLKMMKDADKELVGNQLTSNFQNWLTENPDATIGSFNTWANEQGPWYEAERRARDQKVVKDRYDAMKNTKVAEAVDTLFGEYNDEWATGSYEEQNKVRIAIAESDAMKNLPAKFRPTAEKELMAMFNSFLSPTGQYAADRAAESKATALREKQKWTAAQEKADLDRREKDRKKVEDEMASQMAMNAYDYVQAGMNPETAIQTAIEEHRAIGEKGAIAGGYDAPSPRAAYIMVRDKFDKLVEEPTAPPGTKKAYDASTGRSVFATDAEIAANDNLVPEESNLEKDFVQVGRWLLASGTMKPEVWDRYRLMDQKEFDAALSVSGPDQELLFSWVMEVNKRRAKAATPFNINYNLLNPKASGQATGQTDDGIGDVRLKKKESNQ